MNQTIQRLLGALLATALTAQQTGAFPVMTADAQSDSVCSLTEFAAGIHALTSTDVCDDYYDTLVYDKAEQTLYRDAKAVGKTAGDIAVQNGVLKVRSVSPHGSNNTEAWENLTENAAEYGYICEETADEIRISNDFQTARLIVKAAGSIPTFGAEKTVEGYRNLHILQYAAPKDAYAAYQAYQDMDGVDFVQPSRRIQMDDTVEAAQTDAAVANIADHTYMTWGAEQIGVEEFTEQWLDMENLPEIIVGVVDTGINRAHSALAGRILEDEVNYSDSGDDSANDDYGHGTHCTGTICELTPDNVKILPIKVFDKNGSGTDEEIYLGLMYAIEHHADVINMSFGGLGVSPLEIEAMRIADENGLTAVAAAGNSGDDAAYYYPGGIESCITVAAVDEELERASFSNTGTMLDVAAPGVGVVSLVLGEDGTQQSMNGTSMATPHVTACCALLKSVHPELTPAEVQNLIQANAKDIGTEGFDGKYGWGMVNLHDFSWCDGICHAPTFSQKAGKYGNPITVELKCLTEGAQIIYTTDGTVPTAENGLLYQEPLEITESTLMRAIAVKDGCEESVVAESAYQLYGQDVPEPWVFHEGVLEAYRGLLAKPVIPETLNGESVRIIGEKAFAGNRYVTELVFPDTVTAFENSAFENCASLTTVKCEGVWRMEERVFAECTALKDLVTGERLETVGAGSFQNCAALQSIKLPMITQVPDHCFEGCTALKTAEFSRAKAVGEAGFRNCGNLQQISGLGLGSVGAYAFAGCTLLEMNVSLSASDSIGEGAFQNAASIKYVTLGRDVDTIPRNCFAGCSGIKYISAFCLKNVEENGLALQKTAFDMEMDMSFAEITQVGECAFYGFPIGDGFQEVSFGALTEIGDAAFAGVRGGVLSFPNVVSIGEAAFADAAVYRVDLPQVTVLPSQSVTGCKCVCLSESCTEMAEDAVGENTVLSVTEGHPFTALTAEGSKVTALPYWMRATAGKTTVAQNGYTVFSVLCGGMDASYQWYSVENESDLKPLEQATSFCYMPPTNVAGTFRYACVASVGTQQTEPQFYTLTVTEAEPQMIYEDTPVLFDDTQWHTYVFYAEAYCQYTISAGNSHVLGYITDAENHIVYPLFPSFQHTILHPEEAQEYHLHFRQLSEEPNAFFLTRNREQTPLQLCTAEMETIVYVPFGTEYVPKVTVTAPDGTVLTENEDYVVQVSKQHEKGTVSLFGCGEYNGILKKDVTIYETVQEDVPAPISVKDAKDAQTYVFIPPETAKYYFYSTYQPSYRTEYEIYHKSGKLGVHRYYDIKTSVKVYDASETQLISNSFSSYTGNCFSTSLTLNAGQKYYFVCKAGAGADYNLMISRTFHSMKTAQISGSFFGKYNGRTPYEPELEVMVNGELLTENEDYVVLFDNNDVPGDASASVVGIGKYVGTNSLTFNIAYTGVNATDESIALLETQSLNFKENRIITRIFEADSGVEGQSKATYFLQADKKDKLRCSIYLYDAERKRYTFVMTTDCPEAVSLKNGTYCLVFFSAFTAPDKSINVTVTRPYNLEEAEVTVKDTPYTGDDIFPEMEVRVHGDLLIQGEDYEVVYPENHAMFGEQEFLITPASDEKAYGRQVVHYQVYVDLPQDAPLLTVGTHEAAVTLENRLAVYRFTSAETKHYLLTTEDVMNTVFRVFDADGEMLEQVYGTGALTLTFEAEADKMYFIMVKFNGSNREGTLHFALESEYHLLSDCEIINHPVIYAKGENPPDIQFKDGDTLLQEGVDYMLRYFYNDTQIGTATANFVGLGKYDGMCDVDYDVVAEDLFALEKYQAFPIQLEHDYSASEKTKCPYLIYAFSSGLTTDIHMTVFDIYCRLTVQIYDGEGHFRSSTVHSKSDDVYFPMEAGETVYLLFSAVNINSWNQSFKMNLEDNSGREFTLYKDTDKGVTYRICPALQYAEVFALDTKDRSFSQLSETVQDCQVSFLPEYAFAYLPQNYLVYGYAGCPAAEYAAKNGFVYYYDREADASETIPYDLNGTGTVDMGDAYFLYTLLTEGIDVTLTDAEWSYVDVDKDGTLTLADWWAYLTLLA